MCLPSPLPSSGSVSHVTSLGNTAGGSLPNSQLVTLTACSCLLEKPTSPSREKASLSLFAPPWWCHTLLGPPSLQ